MGPGLRDVQPRADRRGHRPGHLLLRPALTLATRNENTNGLLRQYFPKGSDLSVYAPDYLEHVALKLNNRPRKRHAWKTPAEQLDQLLSEPFNPPGVALTG